MVKFYCRQCYYYGYECNLGGWKLAEMYQKETGEVNLEEFEKHYLVQLL